MDKRKRSGSEQSGAAYSSEVAVPEQDHIKGMLRCVLASGINAVTREIRQLESTLFVVFVLCNNVLGLVPHLVLSHKTL